MTRSPSVHRNAKPSKSQRSPERPSPPSSTQLLLERLAARPPPPKPEPSETRSHIQPRREISFRERSPWLYGPGQWNPYHHYHLPARYKWWYALRRTPRLLATVLFLIGRYPKKRLLNPPPREAIRTPERTFIGRAFYKSLAAPDEILLDAVNKTIRPWGSLAKSSGMSNYPTFKGDREIGFNSYKGAGGRNVRVGEIVSFRLQSVSDKLLRKRVRALEGEVFSQKSSVRGSFMVQVPQGHCYVLGDNPEISRDSRNFGAIPLNSIFCTAIWRWGPDGFFWIDHNKFPWRKGQSLDSGPPRLRTPGQPAVSGIPKARNAIGRQLPKNPVIKNTKVNCRHAGDGT